MKKTLFATSFACFVLTTIASQSLKHKLEASQSNSGISDDNSAQLVAKLIEAPTQVDRVKALQDSDFIFDFSNPPSDKTTSQGKGGKLVIANRAVFPALVGSGLAMAAGFIGPCGLNTPHIHPRATEFFFSVNGTFEAYFIQENGARGVKNTIEPGQGTIFPMGAIHFQTNLGCDTVHFVSGLSNEDPGASQIAQNFLMIDQWILRAALGDTDDAIKLKELVSNLPKNIALGLKSCRKRCGISSN